MLGPSAIAHAQPAFSDLLGKVPEEANALVLINARQLRQSDFARDFRAKTLKGSSQTHQYVVPMEEIERIVLSAELNEQLNPAWEAAIFETNSTFSLVNLASQGHGRGDTAWKVPTLQLPSAYLFDLGSKTYGAFAPINPRQKALRWGERAPSAKEIRVSAYLQKIAEFPETAGTEVMLGLDLSGMVDIQLIQQNLGRSQTLKARKNLDRDAVAKVLASLEGVALGVKATNVLNAKLRVDFGESPALLADFAKPLLLEKLSDLGLMIDEFENWEGSMRGNTFYLSGELSAGGLRKVLSLVDPPSLPSAKPASDMIPSASELDPMALPSQRYFKEVSGLLSEMNSRENLKYVKQFSWYDKYARKISQLSMLNVDPELLDYGLAMSTALRSMAYNLRKQSAEAAQYSYNSTTTWEAYGDWYNGYLVTYNTQPSERQKAEKLSKMYGTMSYAETVQNVGNTTAEMRRRMVERYKIDF